MSGIIIPELLLAGLHNFNDGFGFILLYFILLCSGVILESPVFFFLIRDRKGIDADRRGGEEELW